MLFLSSFSSKSHMCNGGKVFFAGGKGQLCFYCKNRICPETALPLSNRTLSAGQHFGDLSEGSKY